MPRKPALTVTLAEFADDHDSDVRTVTRWIQEGMPHRRVGNERRIVRSEANKWVRSMDKERARAESNPVEAVERARKLRAEADIKEDERDERRGKLVPVEAYRGRLEEFVGGFAATAAGQLHRFERDIVQCGTAAGARKLTQDIHEALMRGAQDYADTIEAMAAAEKEAA